MKNTLSTGILTIVFLVSCLGLDEGFYGILGDAPQNERWEQLKLEMNKADAVVSITSEGKYGIGIGRTMEDGSFNETTFPADELARFFESQRHKDFVLLKVEKRPQPFDRRKAVEVSGYFKAKGYKRVVVCIEYSNGFEVILDSDAKPR